MAAKISATLLSADFWQLGEDIRACEAAGVDWLHFDIMDGHFVPNITLGAMIVKSVRPHTKLPLDVHLMIENPDDFIPQFAAAGADIITVSIETCQHPIRTIELIREQGKIPGVALNPATPLAMIEHLLDRVAMVLVMSVEPGFGGQAFIPEVMPKIAALRKMLDERGLKVDIEVDGNAGPHNAAQLIHAGTTVLVGGTAAVFRQGMSIADATREFRQAIDAASS